MSRKRKNRTGYWDKLHAGRAHLSGTNFTGMSLSDAHAARMREANNRRQEKQENRRKAKTAKAVDLRTEHFQKKAKVVQIQKKVQQRQTYDSDNRPIYRPGMVGSLFYRTIDWVRLRYKAIEKYGRVCQCCGASPRIIHVDHIKPRSVFPELELALDNLQILCEECNIGKGATFFTDWRKSGG